MAGDKYGQHSLGYKYHSSGINLLTESVASRLTDCHLRI